MSDVAQVVSSTPAPVPTRTPRPPEGKGWPHGGSRSKKAHIARVFLNDFVRLGRFQPNGVEIAAAAKVSNGAINKHFGDRKGLGRFLARHHARDVVDALELPAVLRSQLTPRDEKRIAMAVLGGQRLGVGE